MYWCFGGCFAKCLGIKDTPASCHMRYSNESFKWDWTYNTANPVFAKEARKARYERLMGVADHSDDNRMKQFISKESSLYKDI